MLAPQSAQSNRKEDAKKETRYNVCAGHILLSLGRIFLVKHFYSTHNFIQCALLNSISKRTGVTLKT
jgi:hypothetical protein